MKVKNKLKKLFLAIIPVFCVLALFTVPKVDAATKKSRIFLGALLDPERHGIYMDAVEETGANTLETKWGNAYATGGGGRSAHGYCGAGVDPERSECHYLYYPGVSSNKEPGYTAKDEALALNAVSKLSGSIEKVMEACQRSTDESIDEAGNFYEMMQNIADRPFDVSGTGVTEILCYGGGSIQVRPLTSIEEVDSFSNDGVDMGTTIKNWVQIAPTRDQTSSSWQIVQWSVPKGYSSGQFASETYPSVDETYITPPEFISVSGIVWYAVNAHNNESTLIAGAEGYNTLYGYNEVEKVIMKFFTSINTGIARLFGLNTVDNLIFNRGEVGYNYYKGMMPTRWMEISKIFYWISMVVGMFILMYGYLVSVGRISLSSISPSVRITLKDTFLNYALVVVLQVLFIPIFNLASSINVGMVKALSHLGGTMTISAIGTGGVISGVISSLISLGISIAINIQYLHRGLMIALLFASAPIFISSIVIDPQRKMFSVWCRELFAYIFMQTFNAIILAFLFMVTF